ATVALLFWMVKLRLVEPFRGIEPAPKNLIITGGATTVIEAFDVLPVPALPEVACTLLFLTPAVVPCTSTETVQDPPGVRLAPVTLADPEPPPAVAAPPQLLFRLGVEATTRPEGKLSVKAMPVIVKLALVLLMVKVRLVVAFSGMLAAPKALVICGGSMTVRLSVDVLPSPASVDWIVTLLL